MDKPVKVLPMVVGGTLHWFVPVQYLNGRTFELVTLPEPPTWRTIEARCDVWSAEELAARRRDGRPMLLDAESLRMRAWVESLDRG